MAVKPKRRAEWQEVIYTSERWALLAKHRDKAKQVMSALEDFRLRTLVHGSIARGDVNANSDVDVFIPEAPSSFFVETALEKARISINTRWLVQATPTYAVKAHIELDPKTSVSFPLMPMRRVEREFYAFGGELDINQLRADIRVAGVDKRLMLIEPTPKGHLESSIIGREEQTAHLLGITVETTMNRVRVLLRRDKIGRTGVFVKRELAPNETFEMELKRLADENPAVRRRLKAGEPA